MSSSVIHTTKTNLQQHGAKVLKPGYNISYLEPA